MKSLPFVLLAWGFGFAAGAGFAHLAARSSLKRTPSAALATLAALAVSGAAFVTDRPTGVRVADVVLRCALAGLFVVGASRARRSQLVVAAALVAIPTVIAADRASYLVVGLAVATAGAAAASYLFPQRVPVFAGIVGALLSQAALRIPTSLPTRVPSAVAGAALLVLFLSSASQLSPVVRRRLVVFGVATGTVTFFCGVAGSIALVNSRGQVERGISAAKSGLRAIKAGDTADAEPQFATARAALQSAQHHLESPMARAGRVVPVLSQHISTIHDLTAVAAKVVDAAQTTTGRADLQSFRAESGRIDVRRMASLRDQVVVADTALNQARAALTSADGTWLVGPVSERIASLQTEVDDAARSAAEVRQILDVVPNMLGANGKRRYLLVTPTPAEARGSGGVIGNYGEISTDDGRFSLDRFGRNSELNDNGVPFYERTLDAPPDFIARYTRFGASRTWQNANLSPDFPASAQSMAGLYPQSGGQRVDGVFSVDPIALAAFLEIVGPVTVPSWPEPITSENAARVLMLDAYIVKGGGTKDRYTLLADVAQTVWGKLATTSLPNPKVIIDALAPAVRARHLQVWMRDPGEEDYLKSIGLAGHVPPVRGDQFGLVMNNGAGGKIEYFLDRDVSYDAVIDPTTETVTSTATATFRNGAPSTGLPDHIIKNITPGEILPNGTNRLYLSFYSPLQLTGATVNGQPLKLESEIEFSRHVYSGFITIPSMEQATVVATFKGEITGTGRNYRLDVFRQPFARPETLAVTVRTKGKLVLSPLVGLIGRPGDPVLEGKGTERSVNSFIARLDPTP
jgi:hypothetical protein